METIHKDGMGRFYVTPDGTFPSVTTVLAASQDHSFLDEWRARVGDEEADRISKESTDIGTHLHLLFECFLKKEEMPPPSTPEESTALRMFRQSKPKLDRLVSSMIAMEEPVWSTRFRVAGRFDLLAETREGKIELIDFKNARKQKRLQDIQHYRIQLAFYRLMIKQTLGIVVDRMRNFIVTRDGFVQQFVFQPEDTPESELITIRKAFFDIHRL